MTDRAEIERLLNQTGRTLEGLPKRYSNHECTDLFDSIPATTLVDVTIEICNKVLHQSDVIELLVGALRDALPSEKLAHDCSTCGEEYCDVHFYPCCACHNTAPVSMSKWHPEGTKVPPQDPTQHVLEEEEKRRWKEWEEFMKEDI